MAPMTNAERQKKYRQKLKDNAEKYEDKKKRHREYMKSVRKPIKELPDNQQEKIRLQWKTANEKRKKCKLDGSVSKRPHDKELVRIWREKYFKLANKVEPFRKLVLTLSRQNIAFKKQVYRLKCKLQNPTLQMNIKSATVPSDPVAPQAIQNVHNNKELTPMTKTDVFIQENIPKAVREEEKEKVKKKIFELNVIKESIKNEYHGAKNNQAKRVLKNLATNNVAQKYNMKSSLTDTLGLKGKIRKRMKQRYNYKEAEQIRSFFNRDDNSRMSAGKKECITHKKSKEQKRFLLQSIKKLYSKYVSEGGKASLTTFRRNKPFYVVRPKLTDRDTCACLKHSNLLFKAQKLQKLEVLETHNLEELVISVSCSNKSYNCMYSNCLICKDISPPLKTQIGNDETECSWLQWELQEHKYSSKNNDGTIGLNKTKKYVKAVKEGTVSDLTSSFLVDLVVFKKHYFNIQHQYATYREAIDNLKENEACILIDFSENYQCKMSTEIQSLHFGASRIQVTLHTGIIYTKCQKPKSFVSVSPSNEHGPGAIWAHLEPVIDLLKKDFPEINVIHFFSDGPSTQYKQKKNFYQMCKLLEQNDFKYGTWSFFESAHGKGAADGVGGAVKRVMDQQVAYGRDIFSAMDAANTLKENTDIEIFYIPETKIKDKQSEIPDNLVPIPGTMRIHQIVFHGGKLSYRDISCFCGTQRGVCGCYNLKTHELEKQPLTNLAQQRPDKIKKSKPKLPQNKTGNKPKPKSQRPQPQAIIHKPELSPALKSPGSLRGLCIDALNKQLLCKNSNINDKGVPKELNLVEFKQTNITEQKEHCDWERPVVDVCNLSDISKSDNQLSPFVAKHAHDLPNCLKKQSGSSNIKILSEIVFKRAKLNGDHLLPDNKQQNRSTSEPQKRHPNKKIKISKGSGKNILLTKKGLAKNMPDHNLPGPSGMVKRLFVGEKSRGDEWDSTAKISEIPIKYENPVNCVKNLKCTTLKGKGIGKKSTGNKNRKPVFQAKKKRFLSSSDSTTSVSDTVSIHSDSDILDVDEELATDEECDYEISSETTGRGLVENAKRNQNTDEYPYNDLRTNKIGGNPNNNSVNKENAKSEKTEEKLDKDLKNEEDENHENPAEYSINDHVLFRYYYRNKCTYYIGLIETKIANHVPVYMIKFLKTIKKPKLVFRMTKIVDRAEISQISIVKKVDLIQNPVKSNEYMLSGEENTVYF